MTRLWVLYALLITSSIGVVLGTLDLFLGLRLGVGTYIVVVFQAVQALALSWGIVEILIRLQKLTQSRGSIGTEFVPHLILEELPIDDPIPENVDIMVKRVVATISKKTSKTVTLESLVRSGTDYACRLNIGAHSYNFRVPIQRAEDPAAWVEQAKNVLQLMTS